MLPFGAGHLPVAEERILDPALTVAPRLLLPSPPSDFAHTPDGLVACCGSPTTSTRTRSSRGRRDDLCTLRFSSFVNRPGAVSGAGGDGRKAAARIADDPNAHRAVIDVTADDQVDRSPTRRRRRRGRQLRASAEGYRVVQNLEAHPRQLEVRSEETLGLAQRQVEHEPQGQRRLDHKVRELRLHTSTSTWLRPPRGYSLGRQPNSHIAALNQAPLAVPPMGNTVAAAAT